MSNISDKEIDNAINILESVIEELNSGQVEMLSHNKDVALERNKKEVTLTVTYESVHWDKSKGEQ